VDDLERGVLIKTLYDEMISSTQMALKQSAAWKERNLTLSRLHRHDEGIEHIAKRDDMRLKEYMSKYNWHIANAGFCVGIIGMLMNKEVRRAVGIR